MRYTILLPITLILTVFNSFSKETTVDWFSESSPHIQSDYWLASHDSVLIVEDIFLHNNYNDNIYGLQFWDLSTGKLIKKVTVNSTFHNETWIYNDQYQEFVAASQNKLIFIGIKDLNNKNEVTIDDSSYIHGSSVWFDNATNNYILYYLRSDSLYFHVISGESKQQIGKYLYVGSYHPKLQYFLHSSGKIAFMEDTNKVKILNTDNFIPIDSIDSKYKITSISLSPLGNYLGIYCDIQDSNRLRIYDMNNSFTVFRPHIHNYSAFIKFSSDDKKFILPLAGFGYYVYTMNDLEPKYFVKAYVGNTNPRFCLKDNCIVDRDIMSIIRVINIESGDLHGIYAEPDQIGYERALAGLYPDKEYNSFYTIGSSGILAKRSMDDGSVLQYNQIDLDRTGIVESNFNDTLILYTKNQIIFYDKIGRKVLDSIPVNLDYVEGAKVSPNLRWFASETYGKGLILFDIKNKTQYFLDSGRKYNKAYGFSSDSRYLAEGGTGFNLKVFDLSKFGKDSKPVLSFQTNAYEEGNFHDSTGLLLVKFIKNDSVIVTSSQNIGLFKIWNSATGELIKIASAPDTVIDYYTYENAPVEDIFYRKQFNDYVTINQFNIIYWTDDLIYNQNIVPYFLSGCNDYYVIYRYLPEMNKMLTGSAFGGSILSLSLADPTAAVHESHETSNYKTYPNPAHDELYINALENTEIGQIEIVNYLGEAVSVQPFSNHISVGNLVDGMYYIKIGHKYHPFIKN